MSKPTYKELEQRISALEQTEIRHKKSENALQQYKRAVESSLDLMVELDRDYTYLFANKGYLKYHQLNKDQIIGHSFGEVLGEDYFENNIKSYFDRCLEGETIQFETVYAYRGKGKCHMEVWYYPRIEEDGQIHGVVALARDITERKQAEDELKKSEAKYKDMYDNAPDMFVSVQTKTGIILDCNQTLAKKLGYTKEEMIGQPVFVLYTPDSAKFAKTNVFPIFMKTGTIQGEELQLQRKDGSKIDVNLNATAVYDKKGNVLYSRSVWRDITKRKRAEEALRESEKQFRLLIHRIQAAVVVHGADTQIIASNPKAHELLGLTEEQMLGKTVIDKTWKFLDADGNEMPHEEYPVNRVLATQQPLKDLTAGVYRSEKNDLAWVLVNANPVFDDKRNIQQVIVTFVDITDRKRAEESLHERERLLNKVEEIAKIGGWEMNLEKGGEATWTKGTYDIVEINQEEPIPGANEHVSWYLMEYREMIEKKMKDLIEKKQPMQFEAILKTRKGNLKWCQAVGEVVEKNGKVVKARGIFQDITDRKQTEESLKEASELNSKIISESPIGISIYNELGQCVEANNSIGNIVGKTREEVLKQNYNEIESWKESGLLHTAKNAIKDGKPKRLELQSVSTFGANINIDCYFVPFKKEGKTNLMLMVTDITDHIKAEEDKIKALEFAAEQSRHALIGQVAGKMAHDFNNVLMGIMGNAQLATMDCDDEEIKIMLEHINEFALRGRDITSNLISYSKDQEPKQTYFRIEDKIELVLKMLEKDLSGIEISRNYKPGISELLADPGMIQDALVNIIQNSIHAMSKVENPTLNLKVYSQDDKVYVEIEDNGCGIPKEHQESIYTPSFTLKGSHDETGSYNSEIKGTGYGMSNVKKYIVEKHNGDIFLESTVGKGTRIRIALRIIKDHLSSDEKKEVVKSQIYPKRRILLVEDESAIADVQYQLLTKEPFSHIVSIAANGQMAIDTFDRNKFDVVSLDFMLPGNINGLDVYHHIRENDQSIPVLFISGNIEFLESMIKLKQKDPNLEYLSKPIDNIDYVNKINELAGNST